jgi:glycosyltransferase involved in cell wall biosynthesis
MKILMLCEFYNETLEYQENLLVKYYRKYRHDVIVITSTYNSVFDYYNNVHDNTMPSRVYFDQGAKIIKLPFKFNFFGKIKKYTSIKQIVEQERPDLLYIHDIMPNMLEMINYKKRNPHVKMIMDYHADYTNSANNWLSLNVLHKIIRKKLYMDPIRKHIEKFYPIIPGGVRFLNEVYKIPLQDMEILPLGADVDLVQKIKEGNKREILRKKHDIKNEDFVIFTGGKLTPLKSTHLLIEAFNKIKDNRLNLFIIGDSDKNNEDYKNRLIKLANGNSRIHFLGWKNNKEVYEYLFASNLAVFPASQSIIWLQAIASELPLIIGDFGGQSLDYINEFKSIIELNSTQINVTEIQKNIESIFNDKNKFNNMKKSATMTKDKYLDWNHLINNTLKFNNK